MNSPESAPDRVERAAGALSPEVTARYRYWRFRILYASIAGYALFYVVRKNFGMALPGIGEDLGITKATLGLFLTLHTLLYGVSKFLNGVWGDRANPRIFMSVGLVLSAMMSLLFGASSSSIAFGLLWLGNGWFQGMGCAPCIKSLSNWYPASQRGLRFAVWNTSHTIGAALVYVLISAMAAYSWYHWRLAFFVPAAIAIAGSAFLYNRLRDTPESLGLPSVEEIHGEEPEIGHGPEGKISGAEFRRLLVRNVFGNPGVWFVGIASFFVYIARFSVLDWGPTFLTEMKGVSLSQAGLMVAAFEVVGTVGMIAGGWLMDRVFKSNGSLVCVIFMLLYSGVALAFWALPTRSPLVCWSLLCGMGFFVYGPQCLLGPIVANMATKNAAASAVGFVGFFSYLSGTLSGWGLGAMVDRFGWHVSFVGVILSGVAAALVFSIPAIRDFSHRRTLH